MTPSEHLKLVELLARHAYREYAEGIRLTSGQVATDYVDCRHAMGRPEVLYAVAEAVGVARNDADAIGGVAMGGVPIATVVAMRSNRFIYGTRWFYVRDEQKAHGTHRLIEGAVDPGERVVLVDDVVTTGESVINAVLACEDYGLRVAQVIALVDREQGGLRRILDFVGPGVPVTSITTLSEIRACAKRTS